MKAFPGNSSEQNPDLQQLTFLATPHEMDVLEHAFDGLALAFSVNALDDEAGKHRVEILCDAADAPIALAQCMLKPLTHSKVEDADWVAQSQADFKPMHAGRFYIYGSHIDTKPPTSSIPLLMNAGAAFGTGEHATTAGCLTLLSDLPITPKRVLDMGCGTAILGIAAAKKWPSCTLLAADNCPIAVRVSIENCARNHVQHQSRCVVSEGFDSAAVRNSGPYEIILANILALPLIAMAPQLRHACKRGGYIILSGLLTRQEPRVLTRYRAQGFRFVKAVRHDGWSALLMRLPTRNDHH